MPALTASRNTPEWTGTIRTHFGLIPVEASTSVFVGGMVALNANGRAVPAQVRGAAPLDKLFIAGICEYVYASGIIPPGLDALNQTGNGTLYPGATGVLGTAGAISIGVVNGVFGMDYDATITTSRIGLMVSALDDHTVTMGTLTANTTAIVLGNTAPILTIIKPDVVPGTMVVTANTGGTGTVYKEGVDFSMDYEAGLFVALAGGALASGGVSVFASYYSEVAKVPVGRLIAIDAGQAYVDFRDKAVAM